MRSLGAPARARGERAPHRGMHELAITQQIVAICSERAAGARVSRVSVEVGALSCVSPDALRFCFDVCAQGTPLDGAALEIERIAGRARCRSCGREAARESLFAPCACGSFDLEHLAGEELRVREMELA